MASRTVYSFGKMVSLSYSILTIKLWYRRSKYFMPLLQIKKPSLLDPLTPKFIDFPSKPQALNSLFTTLQRCDSVSPLPQHTAAGRRPSSLTTKNKNPAWHHPKDQWRCFPPKLKCKIWYNKQSASANMTFENQSTKGTKSMCTLQWKGHFQWRR